MEATAVVVVHVVVGAVVHKHHWLSGSMWERDIAEETLILFQGTDTPPACFPGHGTLHLWSITT